MRSRSAPSPRSASSSSSTATIGSLAPLTVIVTVASLESAFTLSLALYLKVSVVLAARRERLERRRDGRVVAVGAVGVQGHRRSLRARHGRPHVSGRAVDLADRQCVTGVAVRVIVGQHAGRENVDGSVLADRVGVVDSDRDLVETVDGDSDGGGGPARDGVGEVVGGGAAVAVVRIGRGADVIVLPVNVTVPFVGRVTAVTELPSMSLSLASTSFAAAPESSSTVAVSLTAVPRNRPRR